MRLETRQSRRTHGVSETIYRVFVDKNEWPQRGGDFLSLAQKAYLFVANEATEERLSVVPSHVRLCVSPVVRHALTPRITINPKHFDDGTCAWIYVLEAIEQECAFECVGGATPVVAQQNSIVMQGNARIRRACLRPGEFYDSTTLRQENSLPQIPAGLSSPHDSVMSLSASEGMFVPSGSSAAAAAAAQLSTIHPLMDYTGTRPPDGLDMLKELVQKHTTLDSLLWDRYLDHQNVDKFTRAHGASPAHIVAHGGSAAQCHEAATIGMVESMGADADPRLQHAAHMVSHWLFRQYVFPLMSEGTRAHKWFVQQETRLVSLHERFAYAKDEALNDFLAPVFTYYKFEAVPWDDMPVELRTLDDASASGSWYRIRAIDALALRLSVHSKHARTIYVEPKTHMMYLPARYIMDDLLVLYIGTCVQGMMPSASTDLPYDDTSILDADDAMDGVQVESQLQEVAVKILTAHEERESQMTANLHFPKKDVCQEHLPHLENTTMPPNLMPLCKQRQWRKLTTKGHLKFGERFSYASYLLDLGYTPSRIVEHAKHHFVTTGNTTEQFFESKYRPMATRNEAGQWENGVRTRGYDYSCSRLIEGDKLCGDSSHADADMCIGCPYARLDAGTLRKELQKCGNIPPEDIEEIVATATSGNNPGMACIQHYKSLYKVIPHASWKVYAPRVFTQEYMTRLRAFCEQQES